MKASFSVDTLFRNAWTRYTKRIGSVILTGLLGFGIGFGACFGVALVIGILVALALVLKSPVLYVLLVPAGLGLVLVFYYISAWITLASVRVMTDEYTTQGPWKNFQEVMPMTIPFMMVGLVTTLFMLGLWYMYIFIIPLILWAVWATFSTFVYLDEKKGGLYPLWRSKALTQNMFWAVVGRMLLLWVVTVAIMFILQLSRQIAPLTIILQLVVIQPLATAYIYEMYKALKENNKSKENPKSTVWTVLSILGWILLVLALVATMTLIGSSLRNVDTQKFMNEFNRGYQKGQQDKNRRMMNNTDIKIPTPPAVDYSN